MSEEVVCTKCGHVGPPTSITKGSFAIEVVLWLCFIIPGLIYSLWRLSSRHQACAMCGNAEILPPEAPIAQKFLRENLPEKSVQTKVGPARPPSKTAHTVGKSLGRLVGKVLK